MALLKGERSRIGWLFLLASFLLSDEETVTWLSDSIALTMSLIPARVGLREEESCMVGRSCWVQGWGPLKLSPVPKFGQEPHKPLEKALPEVRLFMWQYGVPGNFWLSQKRRSREVGL